MSVAKERFVASMVLGATGDAMGFKNGSWEFCFNGEAIHEEVKKMGGVKSLKIKLPAFMVSDDTVMELATAEALVEKAIESLDGDKEELYSRLAAKYKESMKDMVGRSPGACSSNACHKLRPLIKKGYVIPFNPRGGGCGAAMRATCIGLRFAHPHQLDDLIAVSIEAGRMTHNNPTGYLGSLAAALFTSYAVQGRPIEAWGSDLMALLPRCLAYVRSQERDVKENEKAWPYFTKKWDEYLTLRGIRDGPATPTFPENYGVKERDAFYKSVSFSGWGGSSGHDAPMISYDALLGCGGDWKELCMRGMLHGGDNDSTGILAGAWYGALYGFEGVPDNNHKKVEYRQRLEELGEALHKLYVDSVQ